MFPDNFRNIYKIRHGTFYDPYLALYGDSTVDQSLCLWADGAIEVFPWLFLGAGITIVIHGESIVMDIAVTPQLEPLIEQSTSRLYITTEIYPLAGILLKPTERLNIGFCYRKEAKFYVSGGNQMFLKMYLGPDAVLPIPNGIQIPAQGHYRPDQYALGVSYQLTDYLLLAADLTYMDWRPFRDEADRPLAPSMKEIFVPRIGMEYYLREYFAVRAGYGFQESPLQPQYPGQPVNLLDNDVHTVSFGLGVFWDLAGLLRKPAQWSLFYELQILPARTFENVHAGGPTIESSGLFHCFGLGVQFKL